MLVTIFHGKSCIYQSFFSHLTFTPIVPVRAFPPVCAFPQCTADSPRWARFLRERIFLGHFYQRLRISKVPDNVCLSSESWGSPFDIDFETALVKNSKTKSNRYKIGINDAHLLDLYVWNSNNASQLLLYQPLIIHLALYWFCTFFVYSSPPWVICALFPFYFFISKTFSSMSPHIFCVYIRRNALNKI